MNAPLVSVHFFFFFFFELNEHVALTVEPLLVREPPDRWLLPDLCSFLLIKIMIFMEKSKRNEMKLGDDEMFPKICSIYLSGTERGSSFEK